MHSPALERKVSEAPEPVVCDPDRHISRVQQAEPAWEWIAMQSLANRRWRLPGSVVFSHNLLRRVQTEVQPGKIGLLNNFSPIYLRVYRPSVPSGDLDSS